MKKHLFLVYLTLVISSAVASDSVKNKNEEVSGTDGRIVTGIPYTIQSKSRSDCNKGGYLVSEHLKDKRAISTSVFLPQTQKKLDKTVVEVSDRTGEWYVFGEGKEGSSYEIRNRQLCDNENPSALCVKSGILKSVKIYRQDKKEQYTSWYFSPMANKSFEVTSNNCMNKGKNLSLSCNKDGKVGVSQSHGIETSWYFTPTIELSEPMIHFVFNDGKDITQMINVDKDKSEEAISFSKQTFENEGNKCSKTFKFRFKKTTEKSWNFESSEEVNFSKKMGFSMKASLPGALAVYGIPVNFSIKVGTESDYKKDSSYHEERCTYEKEESTFEEEFTTDIEPNETVVVTSVYSQLKTSIPFTADVIFTAKIDNKCISAVGVKSLLLHKGYLGRIDKIEGDSVYVKINGRLSLQHSYDFKAVKKSNLQKSEVVLSPVREERVESPAAGKARVASPVGRTPGQSSLNTSKLAVVYDSDTEQETPHGTLPASAFTTPIKAKQNSITVSPSHSENLSTVKKIMEEELEELGVIRGKKFTQTDKIGIVSPEVNVGGNATNIYRSIIAGKRQDSPPEKCIANYLEWKKKQE